MPRVKRVFRPDIPKLSLVGAVAIVFCFILIIPLGIAFHRIDGQVTKINAVADANRIAVHRLDELTATLHQVQCATKLTTKQQIKQQQKYLDDVRSGVRPRLPGVSDNDIVSGIRTLREFLSPYERINCDSG
jgi:hypothetical protein